MVGRTGDAVVVDVNGVGYRVTATQRALRKAGRAKELTVEPKSKATIKDNGAYGLICVQGVGKINGHPLNSPKLIRFTELTEDEYFCTEDGARNGVTFENTSETEPLVTLRYFGPEVNPDAPAMGAYRRNQFS